MKVRVHPADPWGCGHYRIIWIAEALRSQGHDVDIADLGRPDIVYETLLTDADVFVFQRVTHERLLGLVLRLRETGKTVVVDMDDDLTCVTPKNAAWRALHPQWSPHNNWHHARTACDVASLVTVSTPELQRRYGVARSRVLRNCVPRRFLTVTAPADMEPAWGWGGALASHPDDLPLLGPAVAQLQRQGHRFRIVGQPDGAGRALGLSEDPPGSGPVPFDDWADALAANLTVGAAPLGETRFNEAKSWLKPLEYAAVGIPWVGSASPEYRALAQLGGGGQVVDGRTRGWVNAVRRLLADPVAWREASDAARALAGRLTIEEHAWRWMETWEAAWHLDRGRRPATVT